MTIHRIVSAMVAAAVPDAESDDLAEVIAIAEAELRRRQAGARVPVEATSLNGGRMLTAQQAAGIAGVTLNTLYTWCQLYDFATRPLSGGPWRISENAFRRYLAGARPVKTGEDRGSS